MQFNVSHHGDWVILTAESRFSVGCDVMGITKPGSSQATFFRHMRSNFSTHEWESIVLKTEDPKDEEKQDRAQLTRFMRLWTLKESYVKALGEGLSLEPKRVCFKMEFDPTSSIDREWNFDQACYTHKNDGQTLRTKLLDFLKTNTKDQSSTSQNIKHGNGTRDRTKENDVRETKKCLAPSVFANPYTRASVSVDGMPVIVGGDIVGLGTTTPKFRFTIGAFDTDTLWAVAIGIDAQLLPNIAISPETVHGALEKALKQPFETLDPALLATQDEAPVLA